MSPSSGKYDGDNIGEIMGRKLMFGERNRPYPQPPEAPNYQNNDEKLVDFNRKLFNEITHYKEKYSVLLKKTTLIIEENKKQQTEIDRIKIKLAKRELMTKQMIGLKKIMKKVFTSIVEWFNS